MADPDLPDVFSIQEPASCANNPVTAPPASWSFNSSPPDTASRSGIPRPSIFNSPSASRFTSTPSTSTVLTPESTRAVANDEPVRTPQRHLSTLDPSSSPEQWRNERFEDEVRATVNRRRIPRVEKDADDPTSPISNHTSFSRQQTATLTTLSRLFAVPTVTSPTDSRAPSFNSEANAHHRRCMSPHVARMSSAA